MKALLSQLSEYSELASVDQMVIADIFMTALIGQTECDILDVDNDDIQTLKNCGFEVSYVEEFPEDSHHYIMVSWGE